MMSLKELASIIGVSPTTVSFVLNGRSEEMRISKELSERIIKTADEKGYRPNNIAVALRTGQTKILGLIVEDIANNFFSTLAKTIEDEANTYGYKVVYCSTENEQKKGEEMIEMLLRQQLDGYLITPTAGMSAKIQSMISRGIPLVLIDRYFEGIQCPYVLVDNQDGIIKGITHLVKKGYQKIGMVTVDLDLVQMKEREKAFINSMKEQGLLKKVKNQVLRLDYDLTREAAIENIKAYLLQEKPDAVLFATNYEAINGLQAIKELKLKVPEDIGVICFDDNELFNLFTPAITAIRQPVEEIGKAAVKLLMGEMGVIKKSNKKQIKIQARVISRESV